MKHVVLVTYGEPNTPAFIEQLVYSWRILLGLTRTVADIPVPLLPLIALSRARGRTRLWTRNGYRSPLEPITLTQAAQLRSALSHRSQDCWQVHVAYEFREPMLASVIQRLPGSEPVIVVPMYAADSAFTHDLSRKTVEEMDGRRPAPLMVLQPMPFDQLAEISARHIMSAVDSDRPKWRSSALVLAAHGTLLKPARPIETGRLATEQLLAAIERRLEGHFGLVANGWLNHTRGGQWTSPSIEETLQHLNDSGYRDVVYYPYGFLADNAESQLEGRLAASAYPNLRVRFIPCLNGSSELAEALAGLILTAR